MRIGIPTEIKPQEYRVAATPHCVAAYVRDGHEVLVQRGAGEGAGYDDTQYREAGAALVEGADAVFERAEMIVKVKEPLAPEWDRMRPGQLLFTFLHLAANPEVAHALLEREVTGIAYETIELADGSLPCLAPMSEIAGRLAVQEGARFLERPYGGRGVLLGGVPGVERAKVTILGGGQVGSQAAKIALGMGAHVSILDLSPRKLAELDDRFGFQIQTLFSTEANLDKHVAASDLVVGAVLITGATAPKLVRREHLRAMAEGSVVVDVAVDQGGCFETTRPTTFADPVFREEGVQHYCVANMPSGASRTATQALAGNTLPYGRLLAGRGFHAAVRESEPLRLGVNTHRGQVTHPAVAESLGKEAHPLEHRSG